MKCIRRADVQHAPVWANKVVERDDIPSKRKPLPTMAEIHDGLRRIACGNGAGAARARRALADMAKKEKSAR